MPKRTAGDILAAKQGKERAVKMQYKFNRLAELVWAVVVAVGFFAVTVLVDFDPDAITDWKSWAISLAGGVVRAAGGAALAFLRPSSG